jgi:hypothetical protein
MCWDSYLTKPTPIALLIYIGRVSNRITVAAVVRRTNMAHETIWPSPGLIDYFKLWINLSSSLAAHIGSYF